MQALEILFLTTMITLLPSLLVMMTSFTRYIISFSFLRSAIGTQQTPPNMVLVGMALFLTLVTMAPVVTQIQKGPTSRISRRKFRRRNFWIGRRSLSRNLCSATRKPAR